MTGLDIINALFALLIVLGLIGAVAWIVRRTGGLPGLPASIGQRGQRRLQVVDSVAVDARHRLVLIRRDDCEHLLLIGPGSDTVIETNIRQSEGGGKEYSDKNQGAGR